MGEIEDLHAVCARPVGDDEGMVTIDLHVPPQAFPRAVGHRQHAGVHRILGIAQVDEGGSGGVSHQRPFRARRGVGPSPDVVRRAIERRADVGQTEERNQVDVLAGEPAGPSSFARHGAAGDRDLSRWNRVHNHAADDRSGMVTFHAGRQEGPRRRDQRGDTNPSNPARHDDSLLGQCVPMGYVHRLGRPAPEKGPNCPNNCMPEERWFPSVELSGACGGIGGGKRAAVDLGRIVTRQRP